MPILNFSAYFIGLLGATRPFPVNNLFILSIRAIARSILGPVTMHICEPDNALSFKQSHAINRSINSDTPRPVAFFIQRCCYHLVNQKLFAHNRKAAYQFRLSEESNDMVKTTIPGC